MVTIIVAAIVGLLVLYGMSSLAAAFRVWQQPPTPSEEYRPKESSLPNRQR